MAGFTGEFTPVEIEEEVNGTPCDAYWENEPTQAIQNEFCMWAEEICIGRWNGK